ncbi:hypothetical protein CW751_04635 [Brumimicrobium salinarum]|uniref:DUF6036 domain-containing protein n=1 Tax=Brumimicrobium salinarum TaxID=2058658 RepID=A0A2I0R458_9FLAO|nr:nucleotidyl transferase AbiEii/AbiGii toxin family protein [Brumimicrobium salinarum]PKR81347.1 hypothetical protein CW751_04635 [Brumimicrobium salinarum]
MEDWSNNILQFYELAQKEKVEMVMVGGGAVNFHGYKRHSADVDFWIKTSSENLKKLVKVFNQMGYELTQFPKEVVEQKQNISVKFSPREPLNLELITKFSANKSFDEVFKNAETSILKKEEKEIHIKVMNYNDLISSKIKSNRPKDLLDIQELERIRNNFD